MAVIAGSEPLAGVDAASLAGPLEELVELWRRVDSLPELAAPSSLSGERALAVVEAIASVRHASDALLAPYAARLDELSDPSRTTRFARWKGFPNAAALLSHATGLSVAEAGKLIGLGRVLADAGAALPNAAAAVAAVPEPAPRPPEEGAARIVASPDDDGALGPAESLLLAEPAPLEPRPAPSPLAAAIRAGTLGTEKANIIRRTLDDMVIDTADTERFLVDAGTDLSLVELRRLCLMTLAERDPEGQKAREARQRRAAFLKIYEEPDGMVTFLAKLDPARAAHAKVWFEAEAQSQIAAQRDVSPEEQRTLGQIYADIFLTTVRHAAGCDRATTRPKTTLVVRVSREALEAGEGVARCDGIEAPLSLGAALAFAVDAEVAPLLVGEHGEPLALGRTRRSASRAQRIAVAQRDKGCAMCSAAISRCDAHHIVEWARGGLTDVDNLVMLCVGCHHRIHDFGWGIVVENNAVWFIPPAGIDPLRRRRPGSSARLAA